MRFLALAVLLFAVGCDLPGPVYPDSGVADCETAYTNLLERGCFAGLTADGRDLESQTEDDNGFLEVCLGVSAEGGDPMNTACLIVIEDCNTDVCYD